MAFCRMCGNQIDDKAAFCTACGAAQNEQQAPAQPQDPAQPQAPVEQPVQVVYAQPAPQPAAEQDKGGFWWGLLGCCVPLAGLILFILWKTTKPKTARAAGIGALVCAICYVVYILICVVIGFGVGYSGMLDYLY